MTWGVGRKKEKEGGEKSNSVDACTLRLLNFFILILEVGSFLRQSRFDSILDGDAFVYWFFPPLLLYA